MTQPKPYVLSIEPTGGATFTEGYHLGTDLAFARREAELRFAARNRAALHTRTVAVMQAGRVVDVFDGGWSSQAEG